MTAKKAAAQKFKKRTKLSKQEFNKVVRARLDNHNNHNNINHSLTVKPHKSPCTALSVGSDKRIWKSSSGSNKLYLC